MSPGRMRAALRRPAVATPPGRARHVDMLRAFALVMVVLGHWLAVAVRADGDAVEGRSALEVVPWARPLTWLFQVMPLFFLVGGYANAASLAAHRARGGDALGWVLVRAERLSRPTTALLVVLALAALVAGSPLASPAGRPIADPALVGTAVWFAVIPLWFLAVYFAVVLLTPAMYGLHRRAGLAVPVALAAAVLAGDVARLALDLPWAGAGNVLFAWLAVHQAGFCWRDGRLPARPAFGWLMAASGLVALVLLTGPGPYPVSMVAVPGEAVQNTSPPTFALLALAGTQTGIALATRDRADRWLRRRGPWTAVVAVNSVILTVFLWHMSAVVVAALALYPTGVMPQPPVGSAAWFALRVPWLAVLTTALAALVAAFAPIEIRGRMAGRLAVGPAGRTGAAAAGARTGPRGPRGRIVSVGALAGTLAVLAGLTGIVLAGRGYHGPTGLPPGALVAYLCGVVVLRVAWACDGAAARTSR